MAQMSAALTLGIGGTAAVAFDVASIVYLAGGEGDQAGRLVCGIGSMVAGIGIVVPSALLLASAFDERYIPPGGGSEEDAMHSGRAIAGFNIGLGSVSVGLGIAALATYGEAVEQPSAPQGLWLLPQPLFVGGEPGAGLSVGGLF